jgi:hypothetical protein
MTMAIAYTKYTYSLSPALVKFLNIGKFLGTKTCKIQPWKLKNSENYSNYEVNAVYNPGAFVYIN